MATPPSGYSYGEGQQPDPQGQAPLNRFNFPSAPSRRVRPTAQRQPGAADQSHPQQSQPGPGQYGQGQPGQPGQGQPGQGQYGARRPGGSWHADPQQQSYPQQPYQQPYEQGYGQPHQQPGRHAQPQRQPQPQPGYEPPAGPRHPHSPRVEPVPPQRHEPEPAPAGSAHNPLVRPYAMTGGRTRPRYQLAIEALVSTTADPSQLQGQLPEHQRICHLCREIKSIAEISALLSIPLGVSRILVADLAEAGLVAIHQPGGDETAGGQPDVTLLERVLSGLRKL
ncbi:DUF742 domain-containing protein [Streptomyces sp. AC563]|uniref:DUF742 domain-containing protein n=1 Tax=Streptomyces buecherae TaxID=2763006 RepID=UPI00164D6F14|nr:DUF742 domain-containing protein [Streptomyces buecherae]MBC3987557.1 DUF742 domain-containing protein [Streptomyces buecherae]